MYPKDSYFTPIFKENEVMGRDKKQSNSIQYAIFNGCLFQGRLLCVPSSSWREFFVIEAHNRGLMDPFGIDKTLGILEEQFY